MSTHISISEGVEGDVHDILELEVGGVELVYEVCPAVGAQRLVVEVNLDWRSSVLGQGLKKIEEFKILEFFRVCMCL